MCTDSGEWQPADESRDHNTGTSIIVIGIVLKKRKRKKNTYMLRSD